MRAFFHSIALEIYAVLRFGLAWLAWDGTSAMLFVCDDNEDGNDENIFVHNTRLHS